MGWRAFWAVWKELRDKLNHEGTKDTERDSTLLAVKDLTIDFWNQDRWVNVVKQVSFAVRAGESVGLVGESGCGKSTTAYTLLGYRRPNSRIRAGQVQFGGGDLLKMNANALQAVRGKRIALVP